MLEIPFTESESIADIMLRAEKVARESWGKSSIFSIIIPYEGERIAQVHLTGLIISVRWDVASGNVSAFYNRMRTMAVSSWGYNCTYEITLRDDGYADIVRKS